MKDIERAFRDIEDNMQRDVSFLHPLVIDLAERKQVEVGPWYEMKIRFKFTGGEKNLVVFDGLSLEKI